MEAENGKYIFGVVKVGDRYCKTEEYKQKFGGKV